MASYRVINPVFCMGINYKAGDTVPETVARALGADCEAIEDATVAGSNPSTSLDGEENAVEKSQKKPAKGIRRKGI